MNSNDIKVVKGKLDYFFKWKDIEAQKAHAQTLVLALKAANGLMTLKYPQAVAPGGAQVSGVIVSALKDLKELDVVLCDLDPPITTELVKSLSGNKSLTRLSFRFAEISLEVITALIAYLKENPQLKSLVISEAKVCPEGIKALAAFLKDNETLTSLHLSGRGQFYRIYEPSRADELGFHSAVNPEGAKALADALKKNTTLTKLELPSNALDIKGAKALAEMLKTNTSLEHLNLGSSLLTLQGFEALLAAVKVNLTLTSLQLFHQSPFTFHSAEQAWARNFFNAHKVNDTKEVCELKTNAILEAVANNDLKLLSEKVQKFQQDRDDAAFDNCWKLFDGLNREVDFIVDGLPSKGPSILKGSPKAKLPIIFVFTLFQELVATDKAASLLQDIRERTSRLKLDHNVAKELFRLALENFFEKVVPEGEIFLEYIKNIDKKDLRLYLMQSQEKVQQWVAETKALMQTQQQPELSAVENSAVSAVSVEQAGLNLPLQGASLEAKDSVEAHAQERAALATAEKSMISATHAEEPTASMADMVSLSKPPVDERARQWDFTKFDDVVSFLKDYRLGGEVLKLNEMTLPKDVILRVLELKEASKSSGADGKKGSKTRLSVDYVRALKDIDIYLEWVIDEFISSFNGGTGLPLSVVSSICSEISVFVPLREMDQAKEVGDTWPPKLVIRTLKLLMQEVQTIDSKLLEEILKYFYTQKCEREPGKFMKKQLGFFCKTMTPPSSTVFLGREEPHESAAASSAPEVTP